MAKEIVLTGITTSGTPHLGNYVGAIRPAIEASRQENVDAYFFMADYHALIKCQDPARVQQSRLEIAAHTESNGTSTNEYPRGPWGILPLQTQNRRLMSRLTHSTIRPDTKTRVTACYFEPIQPALSHDLMASPP